jgi:hypothetical protein
MSMDRAARFALSLRSVLLATAQVSILVLSLWMVTSSNIPGPVSK